MVMDRSRTMVMVHSNNSSRIKRIKNRRQELRSNRSIKIVNPLREELLHRINATCRTDSVSYTITRAASSRGCSFYLMAFIAYMMILIPNFVLSSARNRLFLKS